MTRDEAIKIETKQLRRHMNSRIDVGLIAAANIDALIELGLLKVDAPKKKLRLSGIDYDVTELSNEMFCQNFGYKLVKR